MARLQQYEFAILIATVVLLIASPFLYYLSYVGMVTYGIGHLHSF